MSATELNTDRLVTDLKRVVRDFQWLRRLEQSEGERDGVGLRCWIQRLLLTQPPRRRAGVQCSEPTSLGLEFVGATSASAASR